VECVEGVKASSEGIGGGCGVVGGVDAKPFKCFMK
jgi:hypothetical protein